MSPALLDAEQAGALLGVPRSWVLAEARADRIPHVRLGRYVRFDERALEEWWRGRLRGPGGYAQRDNTQGGPAARATPRARPTEVELHEH